MTYLDAFFSDHTTIHFQNGCFDRSRCWQNRQTNVDCIGTFRIQHGDLFFRLTTFLKTAKKISVDAILDDAEHGPTNEQEAN